MTIRPLLIAIAASALFAQTSPAVQPAKEPPKEVAGIPVNYDEARTGSYTLPDPLKLLSGKPVKNTKTYEF